MKIPGGERGVEVREGVCARFSSVQPVDRSGRRADMSDGSVCVS